MEICITQVECFGFFWTGNIHMIKNLRVQRCMQYKSHSQCCSSASLEIATWKTNISIFPSLYTNGAVTFECFVHIFFTVAWSLIVWHAVVSSSQIGCLGCLKSLAVMNRASDSLLAHVILHRYEYSCRLHSWWSRWVKMSVPFTLLDMGKLPLLELELI